MVSSLWRSRSKLLGIWRFCCYCLENSLRQIHKSLQGESGWPPSPIAGLVVLVVLELSFNQSQQLLQSERYRLFPRVFFWPYAGGKPFSFKDGLFKCPYLRYQIPPFVQWRQFKGLCPLLLILSHDPFFPFSYDFHIFPNLKAFLQQYSNPEISSQRLCLPLFSSGCSLLCLPCWVAGQANEDSGDWHSDAVLLSFTVPFSVKLKSSNMLAKSVLTNT